MRRLDQTQNQNNNHNGHEHEREIKERGYARPRNIPIIDGGREGAGVICKDSNFVTAAAIYDKMFCFYTMFNSILILHIIHIFWWRWLCIYCIDPLMGLRLPKMNGRNAFFILTIALLQSAANVENTFLLFA